LSNASCHQKQEDEMAKSKSKKRIRGNAPATLKDVAPVARKKQQSATKVGRVVEMCQSGTTIDEIIKALSISRTAAQSLIQDARRKGVQIKVEASPAGVNVFRVV
jgi:DNA invertase Pin-like site-specific DNA recombinase